MEKLDLTPQQKALIEKIGVFYETSAGIQPAQARIIALLLVSDKTELSFEEIKDTLGFSKSSISTALNMLLKTHKVEYITLPGKRKRYFRSSLMNWREHIKESFSGIITMNELFKEVLSQRTPDTKDFNDTLKNITEFMDFLQVELAAVVKKWEEKN